MQDKEMWCQLYSWLKCACRNHEQRSVTDTPNRGFLNWLFSSHFYVLISFNVSMMFNFFRCLLSNWGSSFLLLVSWVFMMNGCWILLHAFSVSVLLCFVLVCWWMTLIDLWILTQTCVHKPVLVLIYCPFCILLDSIC